LAAPYASASWTLYNPKYIRGINASLVFCDRTTAPCAEAGDEWPTAQFDWPAGMPRTMYIGDSIVKVTDSAKRVTTYKFRAYDLAYDRFDDPVPPYVPGREFSPRLKEIIPPGASATKFSYDYYNLFAHNSYRMDYRLQSAGVVRTAVRAAGGLDATNSYDINQPFMYGDIQNTSNGNGGISQVVQQRYYGNPSGTYYILTMDGRVEFETTGRGFPILFDKNAAPNEQYFYETRSNLTKVIYGDPAADGYQIVAEYPATCTNRKTCNQATRIRDANGNWTDYTYYPEHGQVKSITYPANKEGIRAQTRFTYAERSATYFNAAGIKVLDEQHPIWMKVAEEYCIKSAASGDGCEAANDEVVTTYEYNHPNLLMTGMVVRTPEDGVRRTCYTYDKFGNQIGVTTPLGNTSINDECPLPEVAP
jgi:YD repeat-containing protein